MLKKTSKCIATFLIAALFVGIAFSIDKKINIEALKNQLGLKVTVYPLKGSKKTGKLVQITDQYLVLQVKESVFYSKEYKILFTDIKEIRDARGNLIDIRTPIQTRVIDTSNVTQQPGIATNATEETTMVEEPSVERLFSVIDSLKSHRKETAVVQKQEKDTSRAEMKSIMGPQPVKSERIEVKRKKEKTDASRLVTVPSKHKYSVAKAREKISTSKKKTESKLVAVTTVKESKAPPRPKRAKRSSLSLSKRKKARTIAPSQVAVPPQPSATPAVTYVLENLKSSIDGFNKISRRFTLILVVLSASFVSLIAMMLLRRQSDFSRERTELPFRVIKVREDYAIVDEGSSGGLEEGEILLVKRRGTSGLYDIGLAQAVIVLDNRSGIQLIEKLTDGSFQLGDIVYKLSRRKRRTLISLLSGKRPLLRGGHLVPMVTIGYSQRQESVLPSPITTPTQEVDTLSDFLPTPPNDIKKGSKVKAIVHTTQ